MKRIAFLLAIFYCLMSCNNEVMNGLDKPTDDTKPQIELIMPDAELVHLYSTATESENTIDTVWVLAFNGSGAKLWVEKIPGSQITNNGYASQLLPKLTHEPNLGETIVCIANVDPNPDTVNVSYSSINSYFTIQSKGYYYGAESLPMYGEFVWQPATGYTCEMTRAVAKIQIQMGTGVSIADSIGNFSAENVSYKIYRGGGAGTIQPPTSGVSSGGYQYLPPIEPRYLLQKENVTEQDINTYIFEFPSSTHIASGGPPTLIPLANPADSFYDERLHIILEKDNGSAPPTYYRLDFYNPVTKKFLDIQRNHHYIFTINEVRSEGYRTIEEAKLNPGSNIEYTIEIGDGATRVASNGQYAIVTTGGLDTVVFNISAYDAPETVVYARFQLPAEMSSLASGTYNSIELQSITPTYSNAYYDLSPTVLTNANTPITVKVRPAPASKPLDAVTFDDATGVLIFRLGNIKHQVYFKFTMN